MGEEAKTAAEITRLVRRGGKDGMQKDDNLRCDLASPLSLLNYV